MAMLSAAVVFVNDKPIKTCLNPMDTGDLPYDFYQYSTVKGSPWGIGLPRVCAWGQRVINGAWRAMMDNAGISGGPQLIIGRGVKPQDGNLSLYAGKIWVSDDVATGLDKQFVSVPIQNNQQHMQAVIELALRFIDMETTIPTLFQGERITAPTTLGATNIMVDSNNVALRTRVKRWDDNIIKPHISRYYHYNMQYHDDDSVKGDYEVIPKGASVFFERDQTAESLMALFNLRQDPELAGMINWRDAMSQLLQAKRLNVMKSEAEQEELLQQQQPQQQQQQPQDLQLQVAQMRGETEMQKAQLVQQSDMAELEFKAQEAERQRQHEREILSIQLQMKQVEFGAKQAHELEKIKADLAKEASKQSLQREEP